MRCPICGGDLLPERYAGVAVDRCSTCTSLWFDRDVLDAYVSAKRGDLVKAEPLLVDGGTPLLCPRCGTKSLFPCRIDRLDARYCGGCRGTSVLPGPLSGMSREELAAVLRYAAEGGELVALGVEGVVHTVLKLLAGALGRMS